MYSRRQNAGGGVIVWGAISAIGKIELKIMNGRYNADRYIEMIDNACLLEEGNRLCPEKFIFQQDGATIHTAKRSMEYFEAMGIEILPWPTRSADLNPIENVWEWLSNEIYIEENQYNTVTDLKNGILRAWGKLNEDYLVDFQHEKSHFWSDKQKWRCYTLLKLLDLIFPVFFKVLNIFFMIYMPKCIVALKFWTCN